MTNLDLLEIRKAFAIEGAEMLAEMESALLALEANVNRTDEFNRLFRTVHTIKGSASIVSFTEAEQFCHAVEHILVRIRGNELSLNHQLILLLLKCHDHLSAMLDQYGASLEDHKGFTLSPCHTTLLDQLQDWVKTTSTRPKENLAPAHPEEGYPSSGNETAPVTLNLFDDIDDAHQEQQAGDHLEHSPDLIAKNARMQSVMRVDTSKVNQLSDLVVELVTASSDLEAQVRRLGDLTAIESAAHVASLIKQVQGQTMALRMVPVQTLFNRFQRIIHDIGNSTGKQIHLQISGEDTELDKTVAEKLHEPLLHLVRNAIDHGIADASQRIAQGKPPAGTIHLEALHDSGNIVIRVSDDGQGINLDTIARKALQKGLAKSDTLPVGKHVLAFIFEPGFSTVDDPTMLSGRGVGMDVVRKFVDSVRGRIDVETNEGIGTTFQITIPLSLSLVDGFMLSLGSNLYIIPMDLVQETMELPTAEQLAAMPNGCLQVRDQLLPCLDLRKMLQIEEPSPPNQHVIVFKHGGMKVCLIVDNLHGEIRTVIKPLSQLYRTVTCISGAGILGDGSIAFFLETGKLVESVKVAT